MKLNKTERIYMKIEPSVKEQAQKLAEAEGRTLSNYIVQLLKAEIERRSKN